MKDSLILLLPWYKKNNFNMPWRETVNPYNIWISEIMLQQTQVKTVKKYYHKWMNEFPSIDKLAKSNIDDILKVWEGLGYYQRAHNIHFTSKVINKKHNNKIPETYNDLIQLKGIGDYTASAILSIAFSKPYPAIDGNLKRVIARMYMINDFKKVIIVAKNELLSGMRFFNPGDINQALMDLGREICKSTSPKCNVCPIQVKCLSYIKNKVDLFPIKNKVKKIPFYNVVVGMIWLNNKLLISKRKKNGLLGGLWELPGGKIKKNENQKQCLERELKEEININITIDKKLGKIKHQYSHFGINLTAYICYYKSGKAKALSGEAIKWISYKDIKNYAFPKATLKIFKLKDQII